MGTFKVVQFNMQFAQGLDDAIPTTRSTTST